MSSPEEASELAVVQGGDWAEMVRVASPRLSELARAWIAAGAGAVEVRVDGEVLLRLAAPEPTRLADRWLTGPIVLGGRVAGEIRVYNVEGRPPAETDSDRLWADASVVSALLTAESDVEALSAELSESQDQALALYDLADALSQPVVVDDMLAVLARRAVRLTKSLCSYVVFEDGHRLCVATHRTAVQCGPCPLIEDSALKALLELVRLDPRGRIWNAEESAYLIDHRGGGLMTVPLQARGATAGVIVTCGQPLEYQGSPSIKLAGAIARQAGAHLDRLLLHRETLDQARIQTELAVARDVQVQLLTGALPTCDGLDVWASSAPALEVGGDFYSLSVRNDRTVVFSVGDVSGKGMPAALLMAMSRVVLRSQSTGPDNPSPASALDRLNTELYDDMTRVGMFCTVFAGQYHPGRSELTYANAGHSPVIYCPAGGPARMLEADGTAVGVLPMSLCADYRLVMGQGDVVLIGTDGFSEARDASGALYGYDRLLRLAEATAGRSADEIGQAFFAAVRAFGEDRPQDDDQTLVVLKRL